ncbi:hypothetical protein [Ponticaulis sp.]|uniref:hypothetical protein n=1 Tax=Ponticaulis sp. TaxID=2020902 RepID=UPI000B6F8559|nr:hypothetical protein [Ponticaulis sp.]MAJ07604.1 hypothetical protein [Ponticaulis sp.]HBH89723.1 hypothetical protein [Hyphomonadaceae bacterium]HBJ92705.1 hypothetical protein [Hyphomonadaceae bacterium]
MIGTKFKRRKLLASGLGGALITCLAGCTGAMHLRPTHLYYGNVSIPVECTTKTVGNVEYADNTEWCVTLRELDSMSESYKTAALETTRVNSFLGYEQILGAASIAGFTMFDAHPDNIRTAAFLTGAGNALQGNLSPGERSDIFADGVQAINCVIEIGSRFQRAETPSIATGTLVLVSGDDLATLPLPRLLHKASRFVAVNRIVLNDSSSVPDAPVALRTVSILDTLDEITEDTRENDASRQRAPASVRRISFQIFSTAERRLSNQLPDISSLRDALISLSDEPEGTATEAQNPAVAEQQAAQRVQMITQDKLATPTAADDYFNNVIADAEKYLRALDHFQNAPGKEDIEELGACLNHFE